MCKIFLVLGVQIVKNFLVVYTIGNFYDLVCMIQQLASIRNNIVHYTIHYLFNIHFNIILPFIPGS